MAATGEGDERPYIFVLAKRGKSYSGGPRWEVTSDITGLPRVLRIADPAQGKMCGPLGETERCRGVKGPQQVKRPRGIPLSQVSRSECVCCCFGCSWMEETNSSFRPEDKYIGQENRSKGGADYNGLRNMYMYQC